LRFLKGEKGEKNEEEEEDGLGEEEKEIEERIDFERHPPPPLFILIRFMVEQLMPIPSYQVTYSTTSLNIY